MKAAMIQLLTADALAVAQCRVWHLTLVERLVQLLTENGYQKIVFHLPASACQTLDPAFLEFLNQYEMTFDKGENSFENPMLVPGNLLCSIDFMQAWVAAGTSYDDFSLNSKKISALVKSPEDLVRLQQLLFKDSKKETNGWVAKKLNARISIPLSRIFVNFPIHPNLITLLNLPIIALTVYYCAGLSYWHGVIAGVLFQFASVFDGCDGEVARTKLKVSAFGGWLDTFTDNLSYLLFFLAIGYWYAELQQNTSYLYLMAGCLSLLFLALMLTYVGMWRMGIQSHQVYRENINKISKENRLISLVNRLTFLSKRENFALLVMVLCIFNRRVAIFWGLVFGCILYALVVLGTFPQVMRRTSGFKI